MRFALRWEEHLVEAALYASSNGEANVHFTVSHDHLELFKQMVAEKADKYAQRYGIKYDLSFSEQKPSTDTIAANPDNTPFRNEDQIVLFPSRRSWRSHRKPQRD